MTFIGVLLALLAERIFGHLPKVGEPMVLQKLIVSVQRYVPLGAFARSPLAPVLLLLAGTAAAAVLDWWLAHPLLDLAYGTIVLFLCLGPRHLAADIQQLIEAHAADDAGAERTLTRALLRGPGRQATRRTLFGALFIQSHERMFGVLLWFFAAGPAGAVLYRLASRVPRFLHETQPGTAAEEAAVALHAAAAWLPARATAALYGLAGSLDQALERWQALTVETFPSWRERVWAILAEVSAASLSSDEGEAGPVLPATLEACLEEVMAMQQRALLILLAAFGLFSVGAIA